MELAGKVISILPLQSGKSQKGEWKKQEFILETEGQYPKKVCITLWGDKIDQFDLKEGEEVNAGIDIESREYNGRWYTDVKAWKIDKKSANMGHDPMMDQQSSFPPPSEPPMPDEEDDLPF